MTNTAHSPGPIADWLKSLCRYQKVTSVRINGDDARCIALNASAKRFAAVEHTVKAIPDVYTLEALDSGRSIVGAYRVAAEPAALRGPEEIETKEPQSMAGLMAAYARHMASAYKAGGDAVRDATRDASQELTGLVRSVIERLNDLEEARTREANARARLLEKMQPPAGDDGDGMPSIQDLLMMKFFGGIGNDELFRKMAEEQAAKKPNGKHPPNGGDK